MNTLRQDELLGFDRINEHALVYHHEYTNATLVHTKYTKTVLWIDYDMTNYATMGQDEKEAGTYGAKAAAGMGDQKKKEGCKGSWWDGEINTVRTNHALVYS